MRGWYRSTVTAALRRPRLFLTAAALLAVNAVVNLITER